MDLMSKTAHYAEKQQSGDLSIKIAQLMTLDETLPWIVDCTVGSTDESLTDAEMETCDKANRTFWLTP